MMHVTAMLLSYAILIYGSILSIGFLFLFKSSPTNRLLDELDQLSFRSIGIGFLLLTIGILSDLFGQTKRGVPIGVGILKKLGL